MYITEQYLMYRLAYQLVAKDNFNILHLNLSTNEIWVEKTKRNTSKIIRFIHRGFDWKNHLKTDIASVFQRVKTMKRFFTSRNIEIYNVYVTSFEPVDDWETLKKPMQLKESNPLKMKVFYITENNYIDEQQRFLQQINATFNGDHAIPSEDVQENNVELFKTRLNHVLYEKNKRLQHVFSFGKPRFTYLFIYINIFVFLLLEVSGGSTNIETLIQFGAKYNPAIINGEWWRIITSMFLHIGFIHLVMNMIALYYLGVTVERIFGSKRFFIIYLLSGIGGGMTSFAFNTSISAGASGALFGLFGALLFFGTVYKKLFLQTMGKNLITILIINLFLGVLIPQIDMGAHVGGLMAGFIASSITYVPNKKNRMKQLFATIIYITVILFLTYYGLKIM